MPLKNSEIIYRFFENNRGVEYVHFCTDDVLGIDSTTAKRFSKYYFFQDHLCTGVVSRRIRAFSDLILAKCNIDRTERCKLVFGYGAQWFSITHDLACYVLAQKRMIRKHFRVTVCCDEVFLQTIVLNSHFKDKLAQKNLKRTDYGSLKRLIDWNRGSPYVYTIEDIELLKTTDCFARKFD